VIDEHAWYVLFAYVSCFFFLIFIFPDNLTPGFYTIHFLLFFHSNLLLSFFPVIFLFDFIFLFLLSIFFLLHLFSMSRFVLFLYLSRFGACCIFSFCSIADRFQYEFNTTSQSGKPRRNLIICKQINKLCCMLVLNLLQLYM